MANSCHCFFVIYGARKGVDACSSQLMITPFFSIASFTLRDFFWDFYSSFLLVTPNHSIILIPSQNLVFVTWESIGHVIAFF